MAREYIAIKYKDKYPIKVRECSLGCDRLTGEEHYEKRAFMYLGAVRLDVTDMTAHQIRKAVDKLELMGMTNNEDNLR